MERFFVGGLVGAGVFVRDVIGVRRGKGNNKQSEAVCVVPRGTTFLCNLLCGQRGLALSSQRKRRRPEMSKLVVLPTEQVQG